MTFSKKLKNGRGSNNLRGDMVKRDTNRLNMSNLRTLFQRIVHATFGGEGKGVIQFDLRDGGVRKIFRFPITQFRR